jgi:hypothetical protein
MLLRWEIRPVEPEEPGAMRSVLAMGLPAMVVSALVVGTALAGDLQSGVQVGDFAAPFDVKDITGPNKGQTLCYR